MKSVSSFILLFFVALMVAAPKAYGGPKVIVRKNDNLVKVFAGKNKEYVIKEDIDLGGKKVTIGKGCVLSFQGGRLSNGTVVGSNTRVEAENYEIFRRGYTRYRAYIKAGASEKTPPSLIKRYHDCLILEGTWNNKECGSNWTGLLNGSNEDVMLAVKNFVTLHSAGTTVKFPTFNALGYESTKIPGGRVIDFNYSTISYPDDLSIWEDKTILLPAGAIACAMESGYGLISVSSNSTIANLTVDGKSTKRQNEKVRLGVSCIISIGDSKNVKVENVSLLNVLGPAMTAQSQSKDITFSNCQFFNIGEHIMYSHQYLGYCHFEGCIFDTWDSERISVFRNGINYLYKHTPPIEEKRASYDELYDFDLSFTNCVFNNPKRVNSQNRSLGGFLTGSFPVRINLKNCTFTGSPVMINPAGGSTISEKSKKTFKMIVRDCDGAPYIYASKANYNLIAEFYNCTNIPFRVVYAKRYEKCKLFIDLYEDNIENVSSSFEKEFAEPLIIKDCDFIDRGNSVTINHPLFHRPVVFENCHFDSSHKREKTVDLVTVKATALSKVEFQSCDFNLPGYRLLGGKNRAKSYNVQKCYFKSIKER